MRFRRRRDEQPTGDELPAEEASPKTSDAGEQPPAVRTTAEQYREVTLPTPTLKPAPAAQDEPPGEQRHRDEDERETSPEMSTQSICLANFKGGVGKSMTAVNLSAGFATAGYRTLLVDCDPQGNSSEMFLDEDEIQFDLRSIIAERVPLDKVVQHTRIEKLDVLPASFDLVYLDKELVVSPNGVLRIEKALRPAQGLYDFIVYDTGPNLSHLTLGALVASQHIVIPVSAAVWSTAGLRKFLRWIDQNQEDEVVGAQLLGLVATRVRETTRIGQALIGDLRSGDLPAFETFIPERIGAEDAAYARAVLGEPNADPTISEAYKKVAAEIITRIAERQGARHAL